MGECVSLALGHQNADGLPDGNRVHGGQKGELPEPLLSCARNAAEEIAFEPEHVL